jgi:predicted acylesterase/phospholipase RssA
MSYHKKTLAEHLANDGEPKRILALDGGGLKGVLSLAFLQKIEDILRERHSDPDKSDEFRLCHYFDLIAGTSTGAIIAATLAIGMRVEEIQKKYMKLGAEVFERTLLRQGLIRAKYDETKLNEELQKILGAHTELGDDRVQTGLLIVTKRLDTGSPWPISNNPRGKFFAPLPDGIIGNGQYPLWQVVRASTAAPSYFDPEEIVIGDLPDFRPTKGEFVDGGISPFNNPALQAFMYATLEGYRLNWTTGPDKLLLVSVGTGATDPKVKRSKFAAEVAIKSFLSLMDDCAALQETILQWISSSPTARSIDRDLKDLRNDLLPGKPLLTYLRYNVDLREKKVKELNPDLKDSERIKSLSAMDAPENMEELHKLGKLGAERDIEKSHFSDIFNLH